MALVVGIDMATAEVRAVAMDGRGRVRADGRSPLPKPAEPRPGWSEQDARSWWPAVVAALTELTERLGPERDSVVALSVCATSGTVVALDGRGDPVGPALMYSDQRAATEAEQAQSAGARGWASMGLRIQPGFGLSKWGWLLRQPEVGSGAARLAHQPDLVLRRLVGRETPTDWSHALKSGYDPQRRAWVAEGLAALEIPGHLLPEVGRPTEPVGTVTSEASRATGLPPGCEVRLGMTDACAAQLAAGAAAPGRFVSVLGSTLVLKGASRDLVADPGGAVYSHRHPDGWWLPGGASSTGAGALAASFPDADLATLDERAARHGPAAAVVYPLVGRGERFPFAAADAEGFCEGDVSDEVEHYRATLEGVAFVERLGYERLRSLGASVEPPVAAAGGGSASRVWSTIRATVLGAPVVEISDATTARGACVLAAAGSLHPDLGRATEAMAAAGEQVEPDDATTDALDRNYERFVEALIQRRWLDRPG
jgi:sugar (pentulose or hexulose) kinase